MPSLSRRGLLAGGLGLTLGGTAEAAFSGEKTQSAFTFVHITDTHIQPELGAAEGVKKAFAAVRALPKKPAFALVGGDLVMDAAAVAHVRAESVYDLWQQASADLQIPLHYSIGNHDLYGLGAYGASSGRKAAVEDPEFGKNLWKKRLSLEQTYATFDYQGWRFITLDSLGITPDNKWEGVFDDAQLRWLDDLLRKTPKSMPIVFLTHIPIFTIFSQYTEGTTSALSPSLVVKNGKAFKEIIQGYHVRAVFQGHTHVVEECAYLGVRYITGGAVCGDWWKGPRLGVHPEGFTVVDVQGANFSWRYVPYGWKARPQA